MKAFLFLTFALLTQSASASLLWNSTFLFHATHATTVEDIQPSDFHMSYTFPGADSPFTVSLEGITASSFTKFDATTAADYGVDWLSLEDDVANHWGEFEDPFVVGNASLVTEFTTYNPVCCTSSWLNHEVRDLGWIGLTVERFGRMSEVDPDMYALVHVMLFSGSIDGDGGVPGEPSMPEPSTVILVGFFVLLLLFGRKKSKNRRRLRDSLQII